MVTGFQSNKSREHQVVRDIETEHCNPSVS